jgi:hypothetical protein
LQSQWDIRGVIIGSQTPWYDYLHLRLDEPDYGGSEAAAQRMDAILESCLKKVAKSLALGELASPRQAGVDAPAVPPDAAALGEQQSRLAPPPTSPDDSSRGTGNQRTDDAGRDNGGTGNGNVNAFAKAKGLVAPRILPHAFRNRGFGGRQGGRSNHKGHGLHWQAWAADGTAPAAGLRGSGDAGGSSPAAGAWRFVREALRRDRSSGGSGGGLAFLNPLRKVRGVGPLRSGGMPVSVPAHR